MGKFGVTRNNSVDTTGAPHIALATVANEVANIIEVYWGGEETTSTAMRTKVCRAAEGVGAATDLTAHKFHEYQAAANASCVHTYATTNPARDSGDLMTWAWNSHGGVVRWLAAPGEEIALVETATVIILGVNGSGSGTYGIVWEEP